MHQSQLQLTALLSNGKKVYLPILAHGTIGNKFVILLDMWSETMFSGDSLRVCLIGDEIGMTEKKGEK